MDSILGLVRHAGNDALFRALEMSLLAALSGLPLHLHAEGLRGTGKTTIMRAVRRVLPKIRRIPGCLYNCDPLRPHCPQHRHLSPEQAASLGDESVPMPFLEISHSARVGTVIGSLDLSRLVSPASPEAALLPGTIPQAHRGIIFVDEVNRLAETAPELADVLLDAMGTKPGRVQIEETGLPAIELPVQVTVWAASNPDEDPGPLQDIRRQLSDRFDLGVHTKRPGDPAVVMQILALSESWDRTQVPGEDSLGAYQAWLTGRLATLGATRVPEGLRAEVAEIYSRHDLESLRAVQAIQHGLRLHACLEGREEAAFEDLLRVVELALYHRADYDTRGKVLDFLRSRHARQGEVAGVRAKPAPQLQTGQSAALPAVQGWDTGQPRLATERFPAAPKAGDGAQEKEGLIRRLLATLRQKVGGRAPEEPAGPRRRSSAGSLRAGRQEPRSAGQAAPPRAGRLFQSLSPFVQNGGAQGAGGGAASQDRQPAGERAEAGDRSGTGESAGQLGGGGSAPVQTLDPTKVPPVAPPHAARPLSRLLPHELLRTEEELGNR
jgi:magnesium chelatase subunit I